MGYIIGIHVYKYGNLNDERLIANDFMTNHKIFYKSDGSSKKGCFEKCVKYAVWCVRDKFAPEYIYKKKKGKNVNNGHDTLTKNTNGIVQVSPSPTKKRL